MDAQQHLNKAVLDKIATTLAKKIDNQIPDDIDEDDLKTNLGILSFSDVKILSSKNIMGLKINPVSTQDEQQIGATQKDFKRFEKPQLMPFFLLNKVGETVSGSKTGKSFYICFWIPAIGIAIDKANIDLHSEIFELDKPKKGMTYKHVEIKKIPHKGMTEEMLPKVQKALKNGAYLEIFRMLKQNSGGKMNSTSPVETPGEDKQSK